MFFLERSEAQNSTVQIWPDRHKIVTQRVVGRQASR